MAHRGAALEKGMEAFDDQTTLLELDEVYGWREIDKTTMFIGVVGMGGSEIVTTQCFNRVFRRLKLNARSLPLMSHDFGRLKNILDSLKINAVVTSRHIGDQMVALGDELEESARISQYSDLLLKKKDGWQAWNAGWRSAVKMIEQTVSGSGNDKRPLDKQNVLVVGSGSLARSMVYGIGKRKGLVSITAPDDKEAQNLATQFDVRFVPFQHLYNTLADVVVFAEPGLASGSSKTEFNPSYLEARMTVCDATEAPFDSVFTAEARGRGAKVVEPKMIYADLLSAQIKSITGKDVPASEFTEVIEAAIAAQRAEADL